MTWRNSGLLCFYQHNRSWFPCSWPLFAALETPSQNRVSVARIGVAYSVPLPSLWVPSHLPFLLWSAIYLDDANLQSTLILSHGFSHLHTSLWPRSLKSYTSMPNCYVTFLVGLNETKYLVTSNRREFWFTEFLKRKQGNTKKNNQCLRLCHRSNISGQRHRILHCQYQWHWTWHAAVHRFTPGSEGWQRWTLLPPSSAEEILIGWWFFESFTFQIKVWGKSAYMTEARPCTHALDLRKP